MIKKLTATVLFLTLFLSPTPVAAIINTDGLPANRETNKNDVDAALEEYKNAQIEAVKITRLKDLAGKAIDLRIAHMEQLKMRITASKISESDKLVLTADLQTNIDGLTALKTSVAAESDLTSLKQKAHAVYADYRVYLAVLPRVHARFGAFRLKNVLTQTAALEAKMDKVIKQLAGLGIDTAELEAWAADFTDKITRAQAKVAAADAKFVMIDAANSEELNRQYLNEGRELLTEAKELLTGSREDLKNIKARITQEIKDIKEPSQSASQ